jgi:hypothetical protein
MRGVSIIGLVTCAACALCACGPSPAMQTRRPEPLPPNAVIVEACDEMGDDAEETPAPVKKSVEYVRIDEWQAPPSAREIEARIEPRGNKPPDYVSLPTLTKHREIAPTTTYRVGRYWW